MGINILIINIKVDILVTSQMPQRERGKINKQNNRKFFPTKFYQNTVLAPTHISV